MSDDNLPIDIQCNKLLDWLISRNHCTRNWMTLVPEKISNFDSAKNYYDLIKISEDKNLTLDSGSMFTKITRGRNAKLSDSDQKLQNDISDLVSEYIKNKNCHMAETASMLARLLYFEASALQKQLKNFNEKEKELNNDLNHYNKVLESSKVNFTALCSEHNLDLSDTNVNNDASMEKDIKNQLVRSCYKLKDFAAAIKNDVIGHQDVLLEMIENYAALNPTMNSISVIPAFLKNEAHKNEADFALDEKILTAIGESSGDDEEEVDWSAYITEEDQTPKANPTSSCDSATSSDTNGKSWDLCDSDQEKKSDKGSENSSSLKFLNRTYRSRYMLELSELESFYNAKLQFSSNQITDMLNLTDQFEQLKIGQGKTSASGSAVYEGYLTAIRAIKNKLNEENFNRLLRIIDSEHFLNGLVDDIKSKGLLSKKYAGSIETCKKELDEAQKGRVKVVEEMKGLSQECFKRKKILEEIISEKYDNRPVNIMGPFNNLQVVS